MYKLLRTRYDLAQPVPNITDNLTDVPLQI